MGQPEGEFACSDCFDDYAIKRFVIENAVATKATTIGRQFAHPMTW
jgi:hypothetical protein